MSLIAAVANSFRNLVLGTMGASRDLQTLIFDKDISTAKGLFQNRDEEVEQAIKEYNPETHDVMSRPNKSRKNREDYIVQKLPRSWQMYINEIALFFLLGKPIRWKNTGENSDKAFAAFNDFLTDTRFDVTMRKAKRLAGAETESAKIYHMYKDKDNNPKVKVLVIARSLGYTLRPLFDQYENLLAFGYGYYLKESGNTVEHFDILTESYIYRCRKNKIGWEVTPIANPIGKIPAIYYNQEKEWRGAEARISRDEFVDSKTGDINEYFADPMVRATADVISNLADPQAVGKVVQLVGPDSIFEYVDPPTAPEMKESEKKVLKESILADTFTPDFSQEKMTGLGTLSGEAIRRAMTLAYVKRDNRKEVYDIAVDREKNIILAIMKNLTHRELADEIDRLKIKHEFAEPFDEDMNTRMEKISTAYTSGVISLETAVNMLSLTDDPTKEIERIKEEHSQKVKV